MTLDKLVLQLLLHWRCRTEQSHLDKSEQKRRTWTAVCYCAEILLAEVAMSLQRTIRTPTARRCPYHIYTFLPVLPRLKAMSNASCLYGVRGIQQSCGVDSRVVRLGCLAPRYTEDSKVMALPSGSCVLDTLRQGERTIGVAQSARSSVTSQLHNGNIESVRCNGCCLRVTDDYFF